MNNELIQYLVIPAALLVGIFLLWLLALVIQNSERQNKISELESKYLCTSNNRTQEKVLLINALRTTPRCTADYEYLSNRLKLLDRIDKELSASERREIVNLETCIDEQTQYELDNGINPYKR
jgi:hypothetical protein